MLDGLAKFRQYEIGNNSEKYVSLLPSNHCRLSFPFWRQPLYYFLYSSIGTLCVCVCVYVCMCVCICIPLCVCVKIFVMSAKLKEGKRKYTLRISEKIGNKVLLFVLFWFFISCLHCQGQILERWSIFIEGEGPTII